MFYLVLLVVFVLVILGGVGYSLVSREPEGFGLAALATVVLLVVTGLFSFTRVDARAVGINVSFGKYVATLDNGVHWTAPWSSTEQFSTRVQFLDLEAPVTYKAIQIPDAEGTEAADQTQAGTAYGGDGVIETTVRWRINDVAEDGNTVNGAEQLWKDYKTFDNVRDQLVNPTAKDSFRLVTANFTPAEAKDGSNVREISEAVLADLNETLNPRGITIDSISIKNVHLGEQAQRAVDRVVSADADIDRAAREQVRAAVDAETAKLRATEGALTPEALTRHCLDVVNAWDVAKNGPLPATFDCGMGSSQTPVIVGQK